jgi:hypothetical protein
MLTHSHLPYQIAVNQNKGSTAKGLAVALRSKSWLGVVIYLQNACACHQLAQFKTCFGIIVSGWVLILI